MSSSHSQIIGNGQNDLSGEFESILKQKKKYSFVLNYAMNVWLGNKNEQTFNDLE